MLNSLPGSCNSFAGKMQHSVAARITNKTGTEPRLIVDKTMVPCFERTLAEPEIGTGKKKGEGCLATFPVS